MTVSDAELASYVSDGQLTPWVSTCNAQALTLVSEYIRQNKLPGVDIPETIRDRAITEVGAELFHRKNAPNGVKQYSSDLTGAVAAIRVARDPMVAAYPLLASYVRWGFA